MAEDREQGRTDEHQGAVRPVAAASRRERRASAHQAVQGRAGRPASKAANPAGASAGRARASRAAEAADDDPSPGGSRTARKAAPTPARDHGKKQPSVFARAGRFVREVVGELRKVIWPTRKQQVTYTLVVLVFVAIVVALVAGLDLLFAKGVFWVFA